LVQIIYSSNLEFRPIWDKE